MKASTFQTIVAKNFEPQLTSLGYKMNLDPPGFDKRGNIWFEKKLQEGIFILIFIQPSPFRSNKFISFAVNLIRNDPAYREVCGWTTVPGYFLDQRLASILWISDRHDPEWESDYWWSFPNEEVLEEACQDALEKLLKYGVPYLEDLTTKPFR